MARFRRTSLPGAAALASPFGRLRAALRGLRSQFRRRRLPEQPIIFDFTKKQVYRAADDPSATRDLMRALKEAVAIRKRIRLTVGGTPPPDANRT